MTDQHPADGGGRRAINLWRGGRPRFLVTVDTEEEFDWRGPFTRADHGTTHLRMLPQFQAFCEKYAVAPLYLVDYPVVENVNAMREMRAWVAAGTAAVGAQLHPWVNPPFDEALGPRNSYTGNLTPELQRAKLAALTNGIADGIGVAPRSYRAGRYGVGPKTPGLLAEFHYGFDSSVRSLFDYTAGHGPDFTASPLHPYWLINQTLAELPLTSVYDGLLHAAGHRLYPRLGNGRSAGLASRLGLLRRIALTPEGISLAEAQCGLARALALGLPLIILSFHSPSLEPGHTPYVRTAADLGRLYDWWRGVFDWLAAHDVQPTSEGELLKALFGGALGPPGGGA